MLLALSLASTPLPPFLCDPWAWAVVTGPLWQIDCDESQGWKPGSVTTGPGQARPGMTQAWETESTVDSTGPGPGAPPAPPVPPSTSCLCHSTSKSNPWSKAKKKKGEEKREETEKWKGRGRLMCTLGGKGRKTTSRSLSDRGGSCSDRGTCVPAASQADAKLRPGARWCQTHEKGCHSNTPSPQSEINNLSKSSEEGNL